VFDDDVLIFTKSALQNFVTFWKTSKIGQSETHLNFQGSTITVKLFNMYKCGYLAFIPGSIVNSFTPTKIIQNVILTFAPNHIK